MALDFPNAPALNAVFSSGGQSWRWDGIKWVIGSSGPAGTGDGKNILRRNGGFEVWQRGAGGSASFSQIAGPQAQYNADGWYLRTDVNQTATIVQQAGMTDGSQYAASIQRTAGQTGVLPMVLGFPLDTDEIYPMLGKFVRLSLTLKAGANWSPAGGNISIAVNVGTGTPIRFAVGGNYTGAAVAASLVQALTPTPTRYQINSSAIIPLTTRQAEVTLTWTPVGTAGAADVLWIDDVQLEIVPAATGYVSSDFQRLNFEEQLLLCQRHFWKTFSYSTAPAQNVGLGLSTQLFTQIIAASNVQYGNLITPPVPMRMMPSVVGYNPLAANGLMRNITRSADWSSVSIAAEGTRGIVHYLGASPVGSAAGDTCGFHITLDAGI